MPRKDEIDRYLLFVYLSRNSSGFTNFSRPCDWLDKLPMAGLYELSSLLAHFKSEIEEEIKHRSLYGMPKFSRHLHDEEEKARQEGESLLSQIGVASKRGEDTQ